MKNTALKEYQRPYQLLIHATIFWWFRRSKHRYSYFKDDGRSGSPTTVSWNESTEKLNVIFKNSRNIAYQFIQLTLKIRSAAILKYYMRTEKNGSYVADGYLMCWPRSKGREKCHGAKKCWQNLIVTPNVFMKFLQAIKHRFTNLIDKLKDNFLFVYLKIKWRSRIGKKMVPTFLQ